MNKQIIQNACDSLEEMIEMSKEYCIDRKENWGNDDIYAKAIEDSIEKAKQSLQELKELIKENK